MNSKTKPILVVGGGIGGMTAAVDAAETGYEVILIEKEAYLGGRVLRMHRYFPKMCPPTCGYEINIRRIRQNPNIAVHTLASVEDISGTSGDFNVKIRVKPRFVTTDHSIDASIPAQLTSESADDFNYGINNTKALFRPHELAYPSSYVLNRDCLSETDTERLKHICPPGAINLEQTDEVINVNVGAVVLATGWKPYDATKLDTLGFEKYPNVISNVMMERLAARDGPTEGEIIRPSDGKKVDNIAFVQCAGSRDENHLPYCSAVCCMGSLKQVRYIREKYENANITVFYIDIRTIGREEKFYYNLLEDENLSFIKGKVAGISEEPTTNNLILDVEDTISREKLHKGFDMVVLATGMVPNTFDVKMPVELNFDQYGFFDGSSKNVGVYAVGCAKRPCDVSRTTKDSMGAALKAIQCINRGGA